MIYLADTNELLQNFRLAADVRQVLENFVVSLSLLIGDDAKAVTEAQVLHTMQLTFGKGTASGQSMSGTDTVTFSLIFSHLVGTLELRGHSSLHKLLFQGLLPGT